LKAYRQSFSKKSWMLSLLFCLDAFCRPFRMDNSTHTHAFLGHLLHRWAQSAMDRWMDTNSINRYYRSILLVSFSSMWSIHRLKIFVFLIDSIDKRS
jgi:hypothetical protein